jgi:hypothetical protein
VRFADGDLGVMFRERPPTGLIACLLQVKQLKNTICN